MSKKKTTTKPTHGGPRVAGPGKRMGRPPKEDARSVGRAIRISEDVDAYLSETGSGLVETLVRRTKAFRDWLEARKNDPA